jgi:hypothetical protein
VAVFGNPHLVGDLPARTVVFAYDGGRAQRRAVLDALLEGGEMPGRLPVAVGEVFPRGSGR